MLYLFFFCHSFFYGGCGVLLFPFLKIFVAFSLRQQCRYDFFRFVHLLISSLMLIICCLSSSFSFRSASSFCFFLFAFALVALSEVVQSYGCLLVNRFRAAYTTILRLDNRKITLFALWGVVCIMIPNPCTAPRAIVITVAVNFVSVSCTHTLYTSFLFRMRIVAYGLFFESCKGRIFIFQGSPLPAMLLFVVVIAVSVCCTLIVQPS